MGHIELKGTQWSSGRHLHRYRHKQHPWAKKPSNARLIIRLSFWWLPYFSVLPVKWGICTFWLQIVHWDLLLHRLHFKRRCIHCHFLSTLQTHIHWNERTSSIIALTTAKPLIRITSQISLLLFFSSLGDRLEFAAPSLWKSSSDWQLYIPSMQLGLKNSH